jgi:hypothetical protein
MDSDSAANVVASTPDASGKSRSVPTTVETETVASGLDGRQIFLLFIGSAVFACLVFAIGVFVGRKIERSAQAQAAQQSATDPLAILDEIANAEESLTFHRALSTGTTAPASRPARPAAVANPSDPAARPAAQAATPTVRPAAQAATPAVRPAPAR